MSIQGRRYASDGSPVSGQFQVNTYTTDSQFKPSVALESDGDFVVVWVSDGSPGTDTDTVSIQGQRYAAGGTPAGQQFQVNTHTEYYQGEPDVALSPGGDFVVVWQSYPLVFPSVGRDVQGQRYASNGSPMGGEFPVNTQNVWAQENPSVAFSETGEFVVVWTSEVAPPEYYLTQIMGRRYAADGSPISGELVISASNAGLNRYPSVALDADGDFVVVWDSAASAGTDSSDRSIQGRLLAADGTPVGGQFQVNSYTTGAQRNATVAMGADGDFIVVWRSDGSDGTDSSGRSIQSQRYAADGSPIGGELQVNAYTPNHQEQASVAVDAAGDAVVVWASDGSNGTGTSGAADTDGYSVQMDFITALIFADGFESGDSSAWQSR